MSLLKRSFYLVRFQYSMEILHYSRHRKLCEVFRVPSECKKKRCQHFSYKSFFVLVNFSIEDDKVSIKIIFTNFNCVSFISIGFFLNRLKVLHKYLGAYYSYLEHSSFFNVLSIYNINLLYASWLCIRNCSCSII